MQCVVRLVGDHVVLEHDPRRVFRTVAVLAEGFIQQASELRRVVEDERADDKPIGLEHFHAASIKSGCICLPTVTPCSFALSSGGLVGAKRMTFS